MLALTLLTIFGSLFVFGLTYLTNIFNPYHNEHIKDKEAKFTFYFNARSLKG